ncbi:MAG: ribosome silencing factor [Spirochaetales bacterium]|nr:ribosome silencing factor [Spirochaetales bacterium]
MDDTLKSKIDGLVTVIEDRKGLDVLVLSVEGKCSWTDSMIIATVTSQTHGNGIRREIKDWLSENGYTLYSTGNSQKNDSWILIDCGDIVINLMTGEAREFYQLEDLWFEAEVLHGKGE